MIFDCLAYIRDFLPRDGAMNMAIDEALFETSLDPTLRIYQWSGPAISIGYFGKIAGMEKNYPGLPIVRRWTGGGAVQHGLDLTYTLVIPKGSGLFHATPLHAYRQIHECIAKALSEFGVNVSLTNDVAEQGDVCFVTPSQHDLMLDGRKVAGAAQRRTRTGLLHQGSIQLPVIPNGFHDALAAAFSENVQSTVLSGDLFQHAEKLAENKYATREWRERC